MENIHLIEAAEAHAFHVMFMVLIISIAVLFVALIVGKITKFLTWNFMAGGMGLTLIMATVALFVTSISIDSYFTTDINDYVNKQPMVYKAVKVTPLVSIRNYQTSGTSGKAIGGGVLGTGLFVANFKTENISYYQYIVNTKYGYEIKKMSGKGKKIYFKETESKKPKLVIWKPVYKDPQIEKEYPWEEQNSDLFTDASKKEKYQFVIPKNSVVRDYKIK